MPYLVISTSLNPESKSYLLAREAFQQLSDGGHEVEFLDLRKVKLPLCDGADCYSRPNVAKVRAKIEKATCILVGVPIYNYDCGAAAKNLVELTGRAWADKTVGFLCAAGGRSSYMSVMSFANSLMLDFRCLVIPRFVYADKSAFDANTIADNTLVERVGEFVAKAVTLDGVNITKKP
ncbi:MAG: NAD(P)H-dependent oxidoreductase [Candidatus Melainabacteria bacterium]|nr:NAD(P)H-dependent oxidoreductase [Candidatus Melainabacteria bacterium]